MPKKKSEKPEASAEMKEAHVNMLKVTADELFRDMNNKLKEARDNIASGNLKLANDTLMDLAASSKRMQTAINTSARVLNVKLDDFDDDDDDDC